MKIDYEKKSAVEYARSIDHPNSEKDWIHNTLIDDRFKAAYIGVQQLNLHTDWATYDEYWRSKQNPAQHIGDPGSVTNIIFPVVESQIADLVDTPVDIMVRGVEPSDQAHAEYVKFIAQYIWDTNHMAIKMDQAERTRLKLGTTIWKIYFDPFGHKGRGKVCIDYVGPEKFYPDPKVTSPFMIQGGDYCCQTLDVSLTYLKRRYGKRANYVRPRRQGKFNTNIYEGEDIKNAVGILNDSVTLIEYWEKDEEGKLVVVHKADDVILWDSRWKAGTNEGKDAKTYNANPDSSFYKHGQYPFVVVPCYLREGQVWGMGDVEMLKPTQDLINDLDDQIILNTRLMGNIQIVVGLASGINPAKWTNQVGLRVPARDPNAWKMVQPPSMPPHIMDRRELGKREAEVISGRPDVVEGRKPAGLKAASAIITLQEAGNRRVNHKKVMSQEGLSQVIAMGFECWREHFTQDMAIRVAGKEINGDDRFMWVNGSIYDNVDKLVPDHLANPNPDGTQPLKKLPKVDEEGNEKPGEYETKELEVDWTCSLGAGMPRTKAFLYQAAIELHREQILTTEETRHFIKEQVSWPLMDPFKPNGVFSQQAQQPQQQGQIPGQPTTGQPTGLDPALINQLSQVIGRK